MWHYSEKRNALQYTTKQDFSAIIFSHLTRGIYFLISVHVVHNYTRKSRASIREKLHHCQTYMRHFSHRRK